MRTIDIRRAGRGYNHDLQRLKDLELLAHWRDELLAKTRRAELLFEHYGIDVGCETLADEIAGFTAVVAGIEKQCKLKPEPDPTQPLRLIRGGRK